MDDTEGSDKCEQFTQAHTYRSEPDPPESPALVRGLFSRRLKSWRIAQR
jgi:hypothetical protein